MGMDGRREQGQQVRAGGGREAPIGYDSCCCAVAAAALSQPVPVPSTTNHLPLSTSPWPGCQPPRRAPAPSPGAAERRSLASGGSTGRTWGRGGGHKTHRQPSVRDQWRAGEGCRRLGQAALRSKGEGQPAQLRAGARECGPQRSEEQIPILPTAPLITCDMAAFNAGRGGSALLR